MVWDQDTSSKMSHQDSHIAFTAGTRKLTPASLYLTYEQLSALPDFFFISFTLQLVRTVKKLPLKHFRNAT